MVQDKSQNIYTHHLADFDQYILSAMKKKEMCPNEGDTLQIVLLGFPYKQSELGHSFSISWSTGILGRDFFVCTGKEEDLLVDFFNNPLRSGEFVRTGATYAAAALAVLYEIFSESCPKLVRIASSSETRS